MDSKFQDLQFVKRGEHDAVGTLFAALVIHMFIMISPQHSIWIDFGLIWFISPRVIRYSIATFAHFFDFFLISPVVGKSFRYRCQPHILPEELPISAAVARALGFSQQLIIWEGQHMFVYPFLKTRELAEKNPLILLW